MPDVKNQILIEQLADDEALRERNECPATPSLKYGHLTGEAIRVIVAETFAEENKIRDSEKRNRPHAAHKRFPGEMRDRLEEAAEACLRSCAWLDAWQSLNIHM